MRRLQRFFAACGAAAWTAAVVVASVAGAHGLAAGEPPSEYHVKALFLLNFARFAEWPPEAFRSDSEPFVIAIVGDDPFGELLDQAIAGQRIAGREIVVRRSLNGKPPSGSHLLFVGGSERRRVRPLLESLQELPVLTVSDIDEFAEAGGMIKLRKERYKIAFDINVDSAARARIRFRATLLSLARVVKSRPAL